MLLNFKDDNKNDVESYIDENLKKNLDEVKDSVLKKGWDYVAVVSGIVGVGKSTFAQKICKYLDSSFNTKERICFKAMGEDGFLERTTKGTLGQAFMLDESFADLNTRMSKGSDFVKIINHLQLIRQRGLFLILCLPNFFDLSKGVAVFRASHLFVVYHDGFNRGYFCAYGRDEKRKLYVKGSKYMDYNAEKPNFRGRFTKEWVADLKLYEELKYAHLQAQAKTDEKVLLEKYRDIVLRGALKILRKHYKDVEIFKLLNIKRDFFYDRIREDAPNAMEESGL